MSDVSEIVTALINKECVGAEDVCETIKGVRRALSEELNEISYPLTPAVPIDQSIQKDYIVCLEDGKKLKMLKHYIKRKYDMEPEEYRQKWGLPFDYPMIAPSLSQKRSAIAKEIGLGRVAGEACA